MSVLQRHKFKLGSIARDTVTSYEGQVIGRTEWLWGCVTYGVQPGKLEKGKVVDTEWFDEDRLVEVKATKEKPKPRTGGPQMAVPDRPTR